MVFTNCKGLIIIDGDVNLTSVDGDGDENKSPLKVENKNDIDYHEDQEEVHPNQGDQNIIQKPVRV